MAWMTQLNEPNMEDSCELIRAASEGDTGTVRASLDRGANIEATNRVSFSFSDPFSVWFADSSTLTLILTEP